MGRYFHENINLTTIQFVCVLNKVILIDHFFEAIMKLITRKRAGSLVTSAVFITTAFPMSGCHPLLPLTPLILLGQGVDYTANALANATYTEETSPTVT